MESMRTFAMHSPQCITFLHFLEVSTSLWSLRHLGYGYSPSSFAYVLYDPGMAFTACFDTSNLNSIVYSITISSTSHTPPSFRSLWRPEAATTGLFTAQRHLKSATLHLCLRRPPVLLFVLDPHPLSHLQLNRASFLRGKRPWPLLVSCAREP